MGFNIVWVSVQSRNISHGIGLLSQKWIQLTTFNVYCVYQVANIFGFVLCAQRFTSYGRISFLHEYCSTYRCFICSGWGFECVFRQFWFSAQYHHIECIRCIGKKVWNFYWSLVAENIYIYEIYDLNRSHSIPKCWIILFRAKTKSMGVEVCALDLYGFAFLWCGMIGSLLPFNCSKSKNSEKPCKLIPNLIIWYLIRFSVGLRTRTSTRSFVRRFLKKYY